MKYLFATICNCLKIFSSEILSARRIEKDGNKKTRKIAFVVYSLLQPFNKSFDKSQLP